MQHFQKMDFKAAKEEAKDVFRKLFSTVKNNTGYPEPAAVKRKDGEEIVVPLSALKEIRRHSADRRVLVAVSMGQIKKKSPHQTMLLDPKTSHSLIRASLSIVYRNGWQKSKKLPIKSGEMEKSCRVL